MEGAEQKTLCHSWCQGLQCWAVRAAAQLLVLRSKWLQRGFMAGQLACLSYVPVNVSEAVSVLHLEASLCQANAMQLLLFGFRLIPASCEAA